MESQPQNPEFKINPENFHPCANDNLKAGRVIICNELSMHTSPEDQQALFELQGHSL